LYVLWPRGRVSSTGMKPRIGIDLGGTKIAGVALDGARELARARVPTPRDDYTGTLEAIAGLVAQLEGAAGARGTVGVGIPGALSPATGLVKNANSVWLIGRPLQADLAARLDRPVAMANDADCFAVSEAADGAGAGAASVFGVILGTGVGGGFVVGGRPVTGPNAVAGEWGHNPLPWADEAERPGPPCYCGKHGCIETFLSGPGLAADWALAGGGPSGARGAAEAVVAAAGRGDTTAEAALARYEHRLARALATVVNIIDPEVIVLGGGLSNVARWYETVPRLWAAWVFGAGETTPVRTRLVPARHGDASGVRGAAWLPTPVGQ
jgi:fructokinase